MNPKGMARSLGFFIFMPPRTAGKTGAIFARDNRKA
jgi:hypothetical protein